jgi:hypothetical protein
VSIKAVEWAMRAQGVSASAKLLLITLSEIINAKGEFCWPRQELLAERVMKDERTIRRLTRELEAASLIRYQPGRGLGRGKGRSEGRFYLAVDPETGAARTLPELTAGQKCPPVKPNTTGHERPPVSVTSGQKCPPVSVTAGQNPPLQADTSVRSGTGREPKKLISNVNENQTVVAADAPTTDLFDAAPAGKPKSEKRGSQIKPGDGTRAVEAYNAAAEAAGWVKAKMQPDDPRKKAIQARLNQVGLDGWMAQIEMAKRQPFLAGDSARGWRMDLAWLLKPANWVKVAEGTYLRDLSATAKAKRKPNNGVLPNIYTG